MIFFQEDTYKKSKRVHSSDEGKVRRRCEPHLDVEDASADLGPAKGFIRLLGKAIVTNSISIHTHVLVRSELVLLSYLKRPPPSVDSRWRANSRSSGVRYVAVPTLFGKPRYAIRPAITVY